MSRLSLPAEALELLSPPLDLLLAEEMEIQTDTRILRIEQVSSGAVSLELLAGCGTLILRSVDLIHWEEVFYTGVCCCESYHRHVDEIRVVEGSVFYRLQDADSEAGCGPCNSIP